MAIPLLNCTKLFKFRCPKKRQISYSKDVRIEC